MSRLKKETIFLILQFCEEEGFKETAHMLERESGCYFDKKHFEDMVLDGKFEDAETYLSCFTNVDDNRFSTKMFFELRKQKFLEALDRNDRSKALDILIKDLKGFSPGREELLKEMTQLLTINNIREHESLSNYPDTDSVRKIIVEDLKTMIEENPLLNGKLEFPTIKSQRLSSLLSQSLNGQHLPCKHPIPDPGIQTLFVDHVCKLCSNPSNPVNSDDCGPSTVTDSLLFPTADESSETLVKILEDPNQISKGKSCQALNEVTSSAVESYLPQKVVMTLNDDSPPTSMDFHPNLQTILLVGTEIGNLGIWDATSGKRLFIVNFEVWDVGACSTNFKAAIEKDLWISVNKVIWSFDGKMLGVAFSKHLVQLYSYIDEEIGQHLEIEAHDGSVNDIAFSLVRGPLLVITCGDDKTVKVWDLDTGELYYKFSAHNAPVCSICPHEKENVHFIFSISIDGKIKAWLYDRMGPRVDYDAPVRGYTTLAYSTNDERLFSCGVGNDGEPFLLEWDDSEGNIKRVYKGLTARCSSKIHFDTTRNRYLVAGDDHMVKYWDMDNVQLLSSNNADGSLLAYPCIRFNREGRLLAVAARENKIKILAPDYDVLQIQSEARSIHSPAVLSETSAVNENKEVLEGMMNTNLTEEDDNSSKFWSTFKISEPSQCQFLQLPVHPKVNKIVRLIYTNAGKAILALASDGINVLWKWPVNEQATSQVSARLWQPRNGPQFMSNDLVNVKPEESIGCFALSKNDSYLISTSGGSISLFNMLSFRTMITFMSPPPKATSISFYPRDNNVIAVGFDDASIFIYNVRVNQVMRKFKGHSTRITSLAFSDKLHVLVSAEVNNQIILWDVEGWRKLKGRHLQIPAQRKPEVPSDTHIQFHPEQINFLAVQDSQLAIYEARELNLVKQWVPVLPLVISHAVFSSDGMEIYAGFVDGTVTILDASNLEPLCRIEPTAYLPPTSSESINLVAMAANPVKAGQFAVGLSDGNVYVMEPPEPQLNWSTLSSDDKDSAEAEASGVGVAESDEN